MSDLQNDPAFRDALVKTCAQNIMQFICNIPSTAPAVDDNVMAEILINAMTTALCNLVFRWVGPGLSRQMLDQIIVHINVYKRDLLKEGRDKLQ